MTDEERTIITQFIERVSGAAQAGGSVPATLTPLPPVDQQADQLIGDLFQRYPEARYRLTQTAFVQQHALTEAQSRISQLQQQLQQAQSAPQSQPAGGGFFQNLFGGARAQAAPAPQPYQAYPQQPQYAPQPQYAQYAPPPGMMQRSGSGFLGSALTTAAGVAGGLVAGNALMNLFEGPREYGGGFGGGGERGYDPGNAPMAGGEAWGAPAADAQVTGGAWDNAVETSEPAGWDQGGADTSGDAGGWDDSNNTGGGDF